MYIKSLAKSLIHQYLKNLLLSTFGIKTVIIDYKIYLRIFCNFPKFSKKSKDFTVKMAPPPKALNNASKITSANVATTNTTGVVTRRGLITRQQSAISTIIPLQKQTVSTRDTTRGKRKAEASPLKDKLANKRSALGNITNV